VTPQVLVVDHYDSYKYIPCYCGCAGIPHRSNLDCYFARRREGSQTRRKDRSDDLVEKLARLEADRMALVARYRKPGLGRDVLMVKHIKECIKICRSRWRSLEPDERRRVFRNAAAGKFVPGRERTDVVVATQRERRSTVSSELRSSPWTPSVISSSRTKPSTLSTRNVPPMGMVPSDGSPSTRR